MKKQRIALIGTGLMGAPMAERLQADGFPTMVYNRTRSRAAALQDAGIQVADSPAQACEWADGIILMLSDGRAIEEIFIERLSEINLAGKTVLQMGTILPRESRRYQALVRENNGRYVEAPVLGSITEVKERRLILMVGSTHAEFQAWEDLFRTFGSDIYWIGEVGQAAALKLALNHLIASLTAAFSVSLGLVLENEVDVELFMAILRRSAIYAPTFDKKLDRYLQRQFDNPNFPVRHLLKDIELVRSALEGTGIDMRIPDSIRDILTDAIARGEGDGDYSGLYNQVHPKKK